MTVFGQLAFPLAIRRVPSDEIRKRVTEIASLLSIENLLDRGPSGLSGGERQRVVIDPVFCGRRTGRLATAAVVGGRCPRHTDVADFGRMTMSVQPKPLTDEERAVYAWQLDVPGFAEEGQERLKGASILVSRVGGLGSVVAYELAAAGVGRLVLAHGGNIKPSDLNRQLLMTHAALGTPRVESAERRLRELNPRLEIVPVAENVSEENAERLISEVDLIVDCSPLFQERFAMNRAAVEQGKALVECAMFRG